MIVNYARHKRTKEYMFLSKGEFCPGNIKEDDWVWFHPPLGHSRARYFLLVGESTRNYMERISRQRDMEMQ